LTGRSRTAPESRCIALDGRELGYLLRRSQRRTFSLHVDERGVRVNAPAAAALREIEGFVRQHEAWLLERLERHAQLARVVGFEPADGAVLPLLGEPCRLRLVERARRVEWSADVDGVVLLKLPSSGDVARRLVTALKARALARFAGRVEEYCLRLGVPVPAVRLSSARTRWGSCSTASGIRLHWRLIHLRPELSDYVVAHEVAHLVEMNHSPRFWSVVQALCPHWRALRAELRESGHKLPVIASGAGLPAGDA
jgi:predicted metal-dependent hydrolase